MSQSKNKQQNSTLLTKRSNLPDIKKQPDDLAEFEAQEINDSAIDGNEFENFSNNDYSEHKLSQEDKDEFDDIDNAENDDYPAIEHDFENEHTQTNALLDLEKKITEADTEYLNQRSQEILEKLNNSKINKLQGGERVQLLIELRKLYCKLFNYNDELMEYIMNLFSPAECFAFLEMMETQRPVTIRVNSLKTQKASLAKSLTEKGVNLEPLDEVCKMAFKINLSKEAFCVLRLLTLMVTGL